MKRRRSSCTSFLKPLFAVFLPVLSLDGSLFSLDLFSVTSHTQANGPRDLIGGDSPSDGESASQVGRLNPHSRFASGELIYCGRETLLYFLFSMGWKAAQKLIQNWKILRGDNVMIIRGKDKGETGVIKRVIKSQNRVIVEGKNLVKKHVKQGQGHEGGIFSVEAPLHVSNVQVVDPVTGKPCKVGVKYMEDGTKVRVSRGIGTSESIIPRPEILKIRTTPRPTAAGPKDTPMDLVLEKTYIPKTGKGMPEL